jgi:hypothetical protein
MSAAKRLLNQDLCAKNIAKPKNIIIRTSYWKKCAEGVFCRKFSVQRKLTETGSEWLYRPFDQNTRGKQNKQAGKNCSPLPIQT